jgi:hypothetical protein
MDSSSMKFCRHRGQTGQAVLSRLRREGRPRGDVLQRMRRRTLI